MRTHNGSKHVAALVLNLGSKGEVWSDSVVLVLEKNQNPLIRRLDEPQRWSGRF